MDVNYLDIGIVLIIAFFAIRGLLRGFIKEILSLAGIVGSIWLAYNYYALVVPYLDFLQNPMWRNVVAYVVIFVFGILFVGIIIQLLKNIFSFSFLPWADKFLGFCFGLCKGLLLCAITVAISIGFFDDTSMVQDSLAMPYLNMLIEYVRSHVPADIFAIFSENN